MINTLCIRINIVSYAISWLICLPLEIVAASITMAYWEGSRDVHPAVWVTIFLVMIIRYVENPGILCL